MVSQIVVVLVNRELSNDLRSTLHMSQKCKLGKSGQTSLTLLYLYRIYFLKRHVWLLFFEYTKNLSDRERIKFYSYCFYSDVINTIKSHNTLLNLTRLIHLKGFFQTKQNYYVSVTYNICVSRKSTSAL